MVEDDKTGGVGAESVVGGRQRGQAAEGQKGTREEAGHLGAHCGGEAGRREN